jgi:hypothetical protein
MGRDGACVSPPPKKKKTNDYSILTPTQKTPLFLSLSLFSLYVVWSQLRDKLRHPRFAGTKRVRISDLHSRWVGVVVRKDGWFGLI